MPGILIMNHSGSDATAASRDADDRKRNSQGKLVNGDRNDARRDTPGAPAVNGASSASMTTVAGPTPEQYSELPPEIAQIPADQYNPLSTLLMRISQSSYNDLSDTLSKMAAEPMAPATNGALSNGLGAASNQANAEANRRKKLLLLKFAQDNRSKFIKLLVLTEWAKKAAVDVSKLIDLFAWMAEQDRHMEAVDMQLDMIKILSNNARVHNPDIATATEILSTGKAPWMPHLGYIPPDPVSSEQALKLLRYMNTSLSIRLNVHETLPRHLRNWRIQSGRATFVVGDELEFDVMSFVEDASEQWFFIDLRLLFSPAPTIAVGSRFYMQLKAQADFVLKDKGLTGLFDFLNNFILTHKISVLRSQAVGLVRAGWAGSLKVEPVHRLLVVSYWTNRPGKKNWIEIGISNNRPKNGKVSWRGSPIPSLTTRWFRQGKQVENANFKFDWKHLSMEKIIKRVIARHTNEILRSTRESFNPNMTASAHLSEVDPVDCTLQASLGTKSTSVTLSLEPVTGNYILRPATAVTARAESAFNQGREPAQMANVLTQVLAQTLLILIQKNAQQLGWQPVARQSLHQQVVTAAVKLDILSFALYWPRGWSSRWALGAIIDASGESWWVFEIGANGNTIEYAEQIKMDRPDGSSLPINRDTLASLERVAVQLLSFRVTVRQLEKEKKMYSLRDDFRQLGVSARLFRQWALHVQTPDLLLEKSGAEPWLEADIKITCEGLKAGGQNVWHIAAGRVVKAAATDMQKLMAASPKNSFKFLEDGTFKILLTTPFGQDILGELRARLRDVDRLRTFATTLQKRSMRLASSSLQKVQFEYGPSPHVAAIDFSSENEVAIDIPPSNPAYRVYKHLTEIANDRSPALPIIEPSDTNGLDRFCSALIMTRSLLKVLRQLEHRSPGNIRNPAIHAHSIFKYRLTYENPVCSFDVRLQYKEDRLYWFVEDNIRSKSADRMPTPERAPGHRRLDNLVAKLKELFSEQGAGWFGTRSGMVAELDAISDALTKLDECVQSCKMEGGYRAPPPLEKPQQQQQAQGGQQAQVNGAGNPSIQQQQARLQQQQQQQQQAAGRQQQQQPHPAQNQTQNQNQAQPRKPSNPQQQQNQRPPQMNGRPPQQQPNPRQQQQQQGRGGGHAGGRPGQSKNDVIEID
jgi:mediator of RNA polymerase II transcription subunit 14